VFFVGLGSAIAPAHFLLPARTMNETAVPIELDALFRESPKVKESFLQLPEYERVGFLRYIEQSTAQSTRERRATIIAMSLLGLACARSR
jgi:uncharacterized protein YdeI (YjbR/CyaY-like superfamily)